MFKKVAVIGICLLSVGIFFSCKTKPLHKRNVFRLNFYFGLFSLDPAFAKDQGTMWADNQLYNGLVQVDSALNVRPCIAKSWNISKDGLLYEFVLRNDVFFHDNDKFPDGKGRKVTAQDFVYSFGRLIDSNVASTGGWLFNEKVDKQLPFEAVNDTIFRIHLKSPFKPMMGLLTLQYCSVVPKEVVDFYGKDYRKHPCGTGPFKFVRWEENNVLILTKNKSYFEIDSLGNRLPYLDGVRINFVADRGTEYFQFIQHKIDFLSGLDVSYKDKLLTKSGELREEWKSKINFCKMPYLNTEYLGIAMTNQPNVALRNKKVRQAINYALDKRKMLMYLRNGIGVPAESGMIPAGLPCYAPEAVKGYSYN
ncbi:MAG TPA: ABC transporter substrate-binding protein, partial [Chitinophagales bacterium]|nr:ABC transporter substrate-binding protein [Chitinophagales bacterium]